MLTSQFAMLGVAVCTVLGAFGALFLKEGASNLSHPNKKIIIGVLFYGIALAIGIAALRFGDLSVLYPINSMTYIWVTILSRYRLGEEINIFKIAGISLIVVGVSIIGIST